MENSSRQNADKRRQRRLGYALVIGFTLSGALCGFLYYRFIGCLGGTLMIAADPLSATVYGGMIGSLIGLTAAPGKEKCGG